MSDDGFFDLSDGIDKGKGITSFKNSEDQRNALIALFGGHKNLPSSVMRADRGRPTNDFDAPAKKYGYMATSSLVVSGKLEKLPKRLQRGATASGKGCQYGALSSFPQNILRTVVTLYSEPGQTVFDPFAGHNSRLHGCVSLGRHYIGCDLSTEFMAFNNQLAEKLRKKYPKVHIELHHTDSRKVPVPDEVGDMTITSPPYYDVEFYGDEPEQLGKCKTYEAFLHDLGLVLKENFRCLKPGAYCAWFINDFVRNGKMHFYHMDVKTLGEQAGFIAHDIMVVDFGPGIRDCFLNQTMQTKRIPKRHEYSIIFRKPTKEKKP